MPTIGDLAWHERSVEEVTSSLAVDPEAGLDHREAARRLDELGGNTLTVRRARGPLVRFLSQFNQPLIYILLGAAGVTFLLDEWIDGGVILAVVVANAIIGFFEESRAVKALDALARSMTPAATVLRAGDRHVVDAASLVPGDLVLLQSGDKVPADLRLVRSQDLQVDESALTGEAVPVPKGTESVPAETVVADRTCLAFASTLVTYGRATGVVVATGDDTELGKVSELLSAVEELQTPLTRKVTQFSKALLVAILVLAAVTFAIGTARGMERIDIFLAAVALTVGAIPEGLPAAMTIMLAIGVSRMASRRAIIRKLPAVETLGSTTVICSDKTGTLTANQMTVRRVWAGGQMVEVGGVGYQPTGEITAGGEPVSAAPGTALTDTLLVGLLCNDAVLSESAGEWSVQGDPTEGALLVAADKQGLHRQAWEDAMARLDAVPFESERQFMATLHATPGDGRAALLKGSVERTLERCTAMAGPDGSIQPLDADAVHEAMAAMAAEGMRVLAFARRELPDGTDELHERDLREMTLLGLQGMIDPPRPDALVAVRTVQQAGVDVVMITGDHPATADAIARQLGIVEASDAAPAVTGAKLAGADPASLLDLVGRTRVFARVAPEQKLRLVEALQTTGAVVAMTGDGVNDAPALKQADIGIAMGQKGTDAAKDAADMVLTDDDFSSIAAAVEEGRGVFDNLMKFIVWTLPTNLGEALVVLIAIVVGGTLPILPVQILWINMATALLLGLTLVFEPKEPDVMARPPRDPAQPILSAEIVRRILLVGGLMVIGAYGLFAWELAAGVDEDEARTVAVNVFVATKVVYLFSCRSLTKGLRQIGLLSNPWVWAGAGAMLAAQLAFTYLPAMQTIFHTAPTSPGSWVRATVAALAAWGLIAVEKWWFSVRGSARADLAAHG